MWTFFSRCLAVVLLSFIEGFGIPPLEGFSYGKPALVSNVCSLPEVVDGAGVLVDPYDILSISNGYKELLFNNSKYSSKHNIN
ncbi:MAG: glycosyltransferase [Bacteroides sp.]|nr:glycosyltransferase [Bacteroides sp.]